MQSDQEPRHSLSSTLSAGSPSSSPRASFSKNRLLSSYPVDESSSSSSPSPVSPTLPRFVSKDGRPSDTTKTQSRLLLKVLLLMCGLGLLGWLGVRTVYTGSNVSEEKQTVGVEPITPPESLPGSEAVVEDGGGDVDGGANEKGEEEGENEESVWDKYVPSEPAAIKLPPDADGITNWTVSIPEAFDFPLHSAVYKDLCSQIHNVAGEVLEINNNASSLSSSSSSLETAVDTAKTKTNTKRSLHWEYYEQPKNFLEPQDAVELGLLPDYHTLAVPSATFPGGREGHAWSSFIKQEDRKICNSSLIFLLQTESAGLGKTLMEMWLAYGLAKKEGRAFFVDDTRWPYGDYSTYFGPPPVPNCLPAPQSAYLACPHTARHLIVSVGTTKKTFGHAFNEELQNPFKQATERQKPIFDLARAGYEALFHLVKDDAEYVKDRTKELYEPVRERGGVSIGVHVRRGDWHPKKHPYVKTHLPLDLYTDAAGDKVLAMVEQEVIVDDDESMDEFASEASIPTPTPPATVEGAAEAETEAETEPTSSIRIILRSDIVRHGNGTTYVTPPDGNNVAWQDTLRSHASQLVIASDDASVYEDPELSGAVRAQEQVMLVSDDGVAKIKANGDESSEGWSTGMEGGFSADAFWVLGADDEDDSKTNEDSKEGKEDDGDDHHGNPPPSPEVMHLRELIGRSYILDLAVLGGVSGVDSTATNADTNADTKTNANTDTNTNADDDDGDGDGDTTPNENVVGADAIVCAISATGCRLLAVMMGYHDAFGGVVIIEDEDGNEDGNDDEEDEEDSEAKVVEVEVDGRWVNVDKVMPWKGIVW